MPVQVFKIEFLQNNSNPWRKKVNPKESLSLQKSLSSVKDHFLEDLISVIMFKRKFLFHLSQKLFRKSQVLRALKVLKVRKAPEAMGLRKSNSQRRKIKFLHKLNKMLLHPKSHHYSTWKLMRFFLMIKAKTSNQICHKNQF